MEAHSLRGPSSGCSCCTNMSSQGRRCRSCHVSHVQITQRDSTNSSMMQENHESYWIWTNLFFCGGAMICLICHYVIMILPILLSTYPHLPALHSYMGITCIQEASCRRRRKSPPHGRCPVPKQRNEFLVKPLRCATKVLLPILES